MKGLFFWQWVELGIWLFLALLLVLIFSRPTSAKSLLTAEILWVNSKEGTLALRIPERARFTPVYVEIVYHVQDSSLVSRVNGRGVCEVMQTKNRTFIKVGVFTDDQKLKERMTWVELIGPATVTVKEAVR